MPTLNVYLSEEAYSRLVRLAEDPDLKVDSGAQLAARIVSRVMRVPDAKSSYGRRFLGPEPELAQIV